MIETDLINYLKDAIEVPCYMEEQQGVDTYVRIERTGGSVLDNLHRATFALQSYAPSMHDASQLNEVVKSAMFEASLRMINVGKVELVSDYNFTDTKKKRYRYQAVFAMYYIES